MLFRTDARRGRIAFERENAKTARKHPPMTDNAATAAKLQQLLEAIGKYDDPRRASAEWKQAYRLLQQTALPGGRYSGVVGMRDVAGLAALAGELAAPAGGAESGPAPAAGSGGPAIDAETLRRALKAFRKRQTLTRLDDESKLGRGPLSKGPDESFAAVVPPNEWPEAVWQELVNQGKLKYLGHGFYELAKQPPKE
jgi:hypothetical protein